MKDYGWLPDPAGVDWILGDPDTPGVYGLSPRDAEHIGKPKRTEPLLLTDALMQLEPNWRRQAQRIGDCVAFGFEAACTIATAVDIVVDKEPWMWKGPYATEPIYGGSRLEARGKDPEKGARGGWRDGSYGAAAAKWITKWGCLRRMNYSVATGNKEHDLTTYSGDKAKQWGNYGCGGRYDKGKLDSVAKEFPCKEAVLVTKYDDAVNCILNGWPIAVCSGQGFVKTRDSQGFCRRHGSWSHCMCFVGVRFDRPGLLCMNSWGHSNKGPHGIETHEEVMKCSFWVDSKTVASMLRGQDSYAVTGVKGLEPRDVDFSLGWEL